MRGSASTYLLKGRELSGTTHLHDPPPDVAWDNCMVEGHAKSVTACSTVVLVAQKCIDDEAERSGQRFVLLTLQTSPSAIMQTRHAR